MEFIRRYKLRPRAAWREALGWSQNVAAERINTYAGYTGLDPDGTCAMRGPHLSEIETWPGGGPEPAGRRPRPYLFALLAVVYGCTVLDLIDLADREHLPPGELLILEQYSQNPAGAGKQAPQAKADPQPPAPARPAAGGDVPAVRELRQAEAGNLTALPPVTVPAALLPVAYRGKQEPDTGGSGIERDVRMTAHEGSDHACDTRSHVMSELVKEVRLMPET